MSHQKRIRSGGKIDFPVTVIPMAIIIILCVLFYIKPDESISVTLGIRNYIDNQFGATYVLLGIACVVISVYMAFSRIGSIRLGDSDKPAYDDFRWGAMIFTATMGADVLFYSACEWALYFSEPLIKRKDDMMTWASSYSLFHWGPTAWSFYIVLSVAFGFMIHCRHRTRQKFSEACRPILGEKTDRLPGKVIDLLAIFALLGGATTTFSVSTPLLSGAVARLFHIPMNSFLTVMALLAISIVYTISVLHGLNGIQKLAEWCIYLFFILMGWIIVAGGEFVYILESGIQSIGNLLQNFIGMTSYMDPTRDNGFPQTWTIFYWAYWLVWAITTPFFIGLISRGRTVKNLVVGGYLWGLAGTCVAFVVMGGYTRAIELRNNYHMAEQLAAGADISEVILDVMTFLPLPFIGFFLLSVTMIYFYATTYDAAVLVISSYSYKTLGEDEIPDKIIRTFWAILLIALPIILVNQENSINSLQSVTIICAFPLQLVVVLIIVSFIKDARDYLKTYPDICNHDAIRDSY